MPLFPWSAQARGFFVDGRAAVDNLDDPELVRCWYSDDNFERLARASQMADRQGVETVSIALAYLLNQPSPVFPLIGPVSVDETRSSLTALDVELTATEVNWLNLEG
jgi:aryl-alcohol dehydrogenase-like predicted oxidoreductase